MKSLLVFTALAIAISPSLFAQNPFVPGEDPFSGGEPEPEDEPAIIGVLFEWITLDHTTANALVRKHIIKGDPADLRPAVQSLLDSGAAELTESNYLTTRSGERAKIESIEEVIYPTEFDPPNTPDSDKNQDDEKDGNPKPKIDTLAPATPSAFDVRNVGSTIEIDPVIGADGLAIDLNFAPEIVLHLGDRLHGDPEHPIKALSAVRQPDFYTKRVSTAVTINHGETILAGVLTPNPKTHPDKRVLLLVMARILR